MAPGRTTRLDVDGRAVWLHVPAGMQADGEVGCVVFQDGAGFLDPDDDLRAGLVLDDLMAAGAVRPTVGVFVDAAEDRNAEYDTFDGTYADLLADRVLPAVAEHVHLAEDRSHRTVCGFSSGGSASLVAAWHRPEVFGAVIGFSASFPQVRGGNPFREMAGARRGEVLRVLLHVGRRDLGWDEPVDNWVAGTLETAAALMRAGHDVRLELGDGGHDTRDAGLLLPEALRWACSP